MTKNEKEFMFEYDHQLHFKGKVGLEDIDMNILEENFKTNDLDEIRAKYTLDIDTRYCRYGLGWDEDNELRSRWLYDSKQGRGAFLCTTIGYYQKQHYWTCQHAQKYVYDWKTQTKMIVPMEKLNMDAVCECTLEKHQSRKGNILDYHECRLCQDFQKREQIEKEQP